VCLAPVRSSITACQPLGVVAWGRVIRPARAISPAYGPTARTDTRTERSRSQSTTARTPQKREEGVAELPLEGHLDHAAPAQTVDELGGSGAPMGTLSWSVHPVLDGREANLLFLGHLDPLVQTTGVLPSRGSGVAPQRACLAVN